MVGNPRRFLLADAHGIEARWGIAGGIVDQYLLYIVTEVVGTGG